VWGVLAHRIYGRRHIEHRRALYIAWRRVERNIVRTRVMEELGAEEDTRSCHPTPEVVRSYVVDVPLPLFEIACNRL